MDSISDRLETEFHCEHAETQATTYVQTNGITIVRLQCKRCGAALHAVKKSSYKLDSLPVWDQVLYDNWQTARTMRYKELQDEYAFTQKVQPDNWWLEYEKYLQSPHWRQLRRFCINRDSFACQNCGRKVTDVTAQVHHLMYDGYNRRGHSFAFECVTLCVPCHEDYHGRGLGKA